MYTVYCTLYTVLSTLYITLCTVYTVHCTLHYVQYTLYSVHYTLYSVRCTLYIVQCTLYTIQCALHIIFIEYLQLFPNYHFTLCHLCHILYNIPYLNPCILEDIASFGIIYIYVICTHAKCFT